MYKREEKDQQLKILQAEKEHDRGQDRERDSRTLATLRGRIVRHHMKTKEVSTVDSRALTTE